MPFNYGPGYGIGTPSRRPEVPGFGLPSPSPPPTLGSSVPGQSGTAAQTQYGGGPTIPTLPQNPSLMDILNLQYQPNQFPEHERTRIEAFLQHSLAPYIGQASLTQLLLGQGKTDPAKMNELMAGIQRGTQGAQQQTQGELAQRGLGASGLGQALAAAQGQAGLNQQADLRANEAQLQYQRQMQLLDLMNRVFQQPYQHSEDRALEQYLGERGTQGSRGGLGGFADMASQWISSFLGGAGQSLMGGL